MASVAAKVMSTVSAPYGVLVTAAQLAEKIADIKSADSYDCSVFAFLSEVSPKLQQSFIDVQAGTRITGVYLPGQGARFFVGQKLQHEIEDPQFAKAFFDIWLDPRTRSPELREQLLGASQ